MSKRKPLTIPKMIALLDNPAFREDAQAVHRKARELSEWNRQYPEFRKSVIVPFEHKWGVIPPPPELLKTDPRQKAISAILTGRWGIIPVFPWTTQQEIKQMASKIGKAIGKVHRDATGHRKALIAEWLRMHNSSKGLAPRSEVAAAVWGRKKGLHRPSGEEAINHLPEERESELMKHFMEDQGMTFKQAEKAVMKRARGSESPAAATVRMAEKRLAREEEEYQKALQSPHRYDFRAYFLTLLFQEIFSEAPVLETIKGKAAYLRKYIIDSSLPR